MKGDCFWRRAWPKQILFRATVGLLTHRDDGVHKPSEIGPAAHPFDGVSRGRLAGIEMSRRRRRQVAAGGETDDADALRIAPYFSGGRLCPIAEAGSKGARACPQIA
jgi:hypothetical protein